MTHTPKPANEPNLSYAPGTPERDAIQAAIQAQAAKVEEIPLRIGGEAVHTKDTRTFTSPHNHQLKLGVHANAGEREIARAIQAAQAARPGWAALSVEARASVFLRAAELLSGPWHQRINAATVLNQSKTAHQAEIDAVGELCDFLRFNAHYATQMADGQPFSPAGMWNRLEMRPLDGFVYAITPFNFTAIAGNLPSAPALMGNTVLWKPSPNSVLSSHLVMELFREAGLPDGVINFVPGDAVAITKQVLAHEDFAGLHYTGSTAVLRGLFRQVGENMERYRCYPRIVGESGGKDFIVAHPTGDVEQLAVAVLRGAFEYQGQKCSAASRLYIPRSLWPELEERLVGMIGELTVGDPADFKTFLGAVISRTAYDKITGYIELAKKDAGCRIVAGGKHDDSKGFFVHPTLVEVKDPKHRLMSEEIFGPVVSAYVYDDDDFEGAVKLCNETSAYALTGAVFARDRDVIEFASRELSHAAGNFYINDKPTGSIVGQQPFGGARLSGTNDKAGSALNLMRWASPRVIKESFNAPRDWRYPFLG
jgi:1-pyrroline-5-carboxylate dehydrogenase